jgi:putative transposase
LKENLVIEMMNKITIDISGAIIHTDHGSHYSAHEYQEWLKSKECLCSMSRLGNSLDNYPIEHHFGILKQECLWHIPFNKRTLTKVKKALDVYYDFYNNKRIQKNKYYKRYFVPNELTGAKIGIISNKKVVQL